MASAMRLQALQQCATAVAQPPKPSLTACISRGRVARPFSSSRARRSGKAFMTKAASNQGESGIDGIIGKLADKYETAQNKPAVLAYAGGSVFAIIFAEWLINKPGLNILLGFPIQLVGLLFLPGLVNKYLVEKKSPSEDARSVLNNLTKKLPGLENESW